MAKVYTKSQLPTDTTKLIKQGLVTYRGCGIGKNIDKTKIKISGKEYMISNSLFTELGGINTMRFSAPYRKG